MLGRKAERITELEARVAQCDAHSGFVPLAEEIALATSAVAMEHEGDPTKILDAIDQIREEKRVNALVALFDGLPADMRLSVLAERFDDPEIAEAIERERDRLVAMSAIQLGIQALQQECRDFRRVTLSNVPEGSRLAIALHDVRDFKKYPSPAKLAEICFVDRSITSISLGGGQFQILQDTSVTCSGGLHDIKPNTHFKDHEVVGLGSALGIQGVPESLTSAVYYGTPLSTTEISDGDRTLQLGNVGYHNGRQHQVPLGVARLEVDGVEVMGASILPS